MASAAALDLHWRSSADSVELCELLHALLDDFQPQAIHEHESLDGWRVFFRSSSQRDAAGAAIAAALSERLLSIDAIEIADDEWARRSQATLTPIRVGKIVVLPPWHADGIATAADATASDIRIVIDPSTGFGTGHHETTRLCLSLLQEIELTGRRVIDVGTGSGVLAIAAALLGAGSVVAFDEDPEALRNASENVTRNDVARIVSLVEADLASHAGQPGAVVVANLTGAVIERYARLLYGFVERDGVLIVSGFTRDESDDVIAAFGREPDRLLSEGEWRAAQFRI